MRFTVTLTHKYVASIMAALALLGTVLTYVSLRFMGDALSLSIEQSIMRLYKIVGTYNDSMISNFQNMASMAAENEQLAQFIIAGDTAAIQRYGAHLQEISGSDFCTVTDARGIVVGRGHSQKSGDDVTNQTTVMRALKGERCHDTVAGTEVAFTLRASSPVYADGRIVGTISIGRALSTSSYVEQLKELTGLDVTIFKADTRIQTTLQKEDQSRAIGTQLEDQQVLDAVFGQGKTFFAFPTLFHVRYAACYWPIKNMEGKVIGSWFIGAPITKIYQLRDDAVFKTLVAGALVLIGQFGIAIFVGIRLGRPVKLITHYAGVVAEDPMSKEQLTVHGKDDMGLLADSLRHMIEQLQATILLAQQKTDEANDMTQQAKQAMQDAQDARKRAVRAKRDGMLAAAVQMEEVVSRVQEAIQALANQVQHSNEGARQSSSLLSETATAMEEMNSTVMEVAKSAETASRASIETRSTAEKGAQVVQKAVHAIGVVHEQSLGLKEDMNTLNEQAQAIGQIMAVISDIADQTNLLALNAAIEAARAGDAGRGFAVVADEVRKLAEKTMASTQDVGNAIRAIQDSTTKNRAQVDKSVSIIAEATGYANDSGRSLEDIVHMVEGTADLVRTIATASEEQSAASEEINHSISDVTSISDQTAQAMRTAVEALNNLQHQEKALIQLIQEMKKEGSEEE